MTTSDDDERRITDAIICRVCGDVAFSGTLCWHCAAERNGERIKARTPQRWSCMCTSDMRNLHDRSLCDMCGKRHATEEKTDGT